jgi:hypothetical protein
MKERSRRPLLKVIARIARTTIVNKMIVAHANKTIANKTIAVRAHKVVSKTIAARAHKVVSKVASPAVSQVSNRVHVSTTTQQIAIAIATDVVVKDVVTMRAHRAPTVMKPMLKFQTTQ